METKTKTMVKIRDEFGNVLTIGELYSGVFTTVRKRSKHFFVKHGGWAIDKKVAEGIEAITLKVIDEENKKVYTVSKDKFLELSEPLLNMGHREQLVLKEEYWDVTQFKSLEERRQEVMAAYNGG